MPVNDHRAEPTERSNRMTWGGTSLKQRRSARRAKLLEVGLELLGTQGSAAVTVRSVCRHAKLTDRYFYESFADRDALLLAVYDQVAEEARAALGAAVANTEGTREAVATAAVEAFLAVLTDDPRKGRVLLLEPVTDATLSSRGAELMPVFADLIRSELDEEAAGLGARMTATALIGALTNLFIRWLDGSLPATHEQLVDYCVKLLLTATSLVDDHTT
ncbi:DNA-binding transcriptional regulator, AcrR family [Saccharopolyspora antimicrobica]|uniref:DNA-binding transcriptional regulator, AcrR family n=2 Tax=Saccharopolyspora antimicrobica TaxID=455193 RepID=A0A1I5GKQ1_9PSEU|nr:TetR family transcriptional regulator [Saccharopolyspora antimicrobica]SFO36565.1 DNA-binding transcriptional regulator, AcrR family [Saccharopolyspora antimicrobica]